MRKLHLSLLLSLVAFFATGCPNEPSKKFPSPNPDPTNLTTKSFVNNVNAYLRAQQIQYNQAVQRLNTLPAGTPADVVARAENNARRIRNDAIEDAIAVIDSNYADYITRVNTRRSTTDFIADVVELGTAGAIGFINGERANQILGIALTAFRGGRRSSELNFYREQTVPILINKMDDGRAQIYAMILRKKADSVNDYSLKESIRDIVAYYNAGTLIRAFTQLQKDAAAGARESENRVLILKGMPVTPPATEAERDAAVNVGDTIFRLRRSLRSTATAEDRTTATDKLQAIVTELRKDGKLAAMLTEVGLAEDETDGTKLLNAIVEIKRMAVDKGDAEAEKKIDETIISKGK